MDNHIPLDSILNSIWHVTWHETLKHCNSPAISMRSDVRCDWEIFSEFTRFPLCSASLVHEKTMKQLCEGYFAFGCRSNFLSRPFLLAGALLTDSPVDSPPLLPSKQSAKCQAMTALLKLSNCKRKHLKTDRTMKKSLKHNYTRNPSSQFT